MRVVIALLVVLIALVAGVLVPTTDRSSAVDIASNVVVPSSAPKPRSPLEGKAVERSRTVVERATPPVVERERVRRIRPSTAIGRWTRARLDRRLDAAGGASMTVLDEDGRTVYSRRGGVPRTLASVTKLYVSAAGLQYRGRRVRLERILVHSDNARSEALLRSLGGGEQRLGIRRVERVARFLGGRPTLYDGSGLDSRNRDSTRRLTRFLVEMQRQSGFRRWFSTLPTRGEGTLRTRLAGVRGCRGKTGTLFSRGHVSTLAGYCDTPRGRLAFAILMRHDVTRSRTVQDSLLRVLTRRLG